MYNTKTITFLLQKANVSCSYSNGHLFSCEANSLFATKGQCIM